MFRWKDGLTYFYIKRIKRWMCCPACKHRMRFEENQKWWRCRNCKFVLTEEEFIDDYVFWFCDECDVFLNNQKGFNTNSGSWICKACGYENDVTENNILR